MMDRTTMPSAQLLTFTVISVIVVGYALVPAFQRVIAAPTRRPVIVQFPVEIISAIAEAVDEKASLVSLALASRDWNTATKPFLFRRLVVSVVPREDQVSKTKLWHLSFAKIKTLSEFGNFLQECDPRIRGYVRELILRIIPPKPPQLQGNQILGEDYALDPEIFLPIFDQLPRLEHVTLKNVYLSRPLAPLERNRVSNLKSLDLHFPNSHNSQEYTAGLMAVTDLFNGRKDCHISVKPIVGLPKGGSPLIGPRRDAPFQCQELLLQSHAIYPEATFHYLWPSSESLEYLLLHYAGQGTRKYLINLSTTPYAAKLKFLQCTFALFDFDFLRVETFRFIPHPFPQLRKLVLGLKVGHDPVRGLTWSCMHYVLQSLTPENLPALRSIVVFIEQQNLDLGPPSSEDADSFSASDLALITLAEEASFEQLVICQCLTDIFPVGWVHAPFVNHYRAFKALFPQLHAQGRLVVPETPEVAAAIVHRHGFERSDGGVRILVDPEERSS